MTLWRVRSRDRALHREYVIEDKNILNSFLMGLVGSQRAMTPLAALAIAGAALASRRQRWLGATIGGVTAMIASYLGWRTRMNAMERHGQTPTGFIEDAAVLTGAVAVVRGAQIA